MTIEANSLLAQTEAFWQAFYARHNLRNDPSPFALWCLEHYIRPGNRILELGCGNGRDSFAFLQHGLPVLAVDGCSVAIRDNLDHYEQLNSEASGQFFALNFSDLERLNRLASETLRQINVVFSRFVLHAIPEELEDALIDFCWQLLPPGGKMLHEFRTIRDPLMAFGEPLSANERVTDHYRRFIDPEKFREKLKAFGWNELFFVESNGLAVFGHEDPVVARVVMEKPQ